MAKKIKYRKYNQSKTKDGFDSKMEKKRWDELLLLQNSGKIEFLRYHAIKFILGKNDKNHQVSYTPDFTYITNAGYLVAEEVKGFRVRDWPVRAALFKEKFPEWVLTIYSGKDLFCSGFSGEEAEWKSLFTSTGNRTNSNNHLRKSRKTRK